MQGCRRNNRRAIGRESKDLVNASTSRKVSRGSARGIDNSASSFLAFESIVEGAETRRPNSDSEAVQKFVVIQDRTLVEKMIVSNTAKHAVTERGAITTELMNKRWKIAIQSSFPFSIVVQVLFFAKGIDATWARATTETTRSRALPESSRGGTG